MIIALSGRKNTGKTTLANLLIKKGFVKISFATALKEYVSKLYNWNLEDLYSQKGKESLLTHAVYWNKDVCRKLEEIVGIKLNYIENRKFSNRREALQYI
jgi:dephospho-CoA kinase